MCKELGSVVPALAFSTYISPDRKDERAARAAYTPEQGKELFRLPPWTGCESADERLKPGDQILHNALFFVLLLVWYTGMRREEVCKLLVDDIQEFAGIWHIDVRFTAAGRVKNQTSVRLVAICDELTCESGRCHLSGCARRHVGRRPMGDRARAATDPTRRRAVGGSSARTGPLPRRCYSARRLPSRSCRRPGARRSRREGGTSTGSRRSP